MANKFTAEYEFYPAEDKYEGDCHRYTLRDQRGLSGADLSSVELRQNPYQKDKFEVTLSFDTETAKRDSRIENVKGLLEGNAGVEGSVKSHGNASGFSVTVECKDQKDLMRLAVALSHDAPKGPRGDAVHYPLMDADVAGQIIGRELDRLQITPVQAGLISVTTDVMTAERAKLMGLEKPVSYVDADFSGYPVSPIAGLREDGVFSDLNGKTAIEVKTRIDIRGGQGPRVLDALQKDGLNAVRSQDGQFINVRAPADAVAGALEKSGLLAPAVSGAIKSAAEAAHPGQQKINMQIASAAPPQTKFAAPAKSKMSI